MNEICEIEDKSVTISFVRDVISADGICIGKRGERSFRRKLYASR